MNWKQSLESLIKLCSLLLYQQTTTAKENLVEKHYHFIKKIISTVEFKCGAFFLVVYLPSFMWAAMQYTSCSQKKRIMEKIQLCSKMDFVRQSLMVSGQLAATILSRFATRGLKSFVVVYFCRQSGFWRPLHAYKAIIVSMKEKKYEFICIQELSTYY